MIMVLLRWLRSRSLLLIFLLVLLGIVAVNAFKQLRGPRYQASARVLISTTSIVQILTQTVPPFVDPNRVEATARALAGSPDVYNLAAKRVGHSLGTPADMAAATSVSGGRWPLQHREGRPLPR